MVAVCAGTADAEWGDEHEIGWDGSRGHVRVKTDSCTRQRRLGDAVQCMMMATYVKHGRRKDRGTDDGLCVGRMLNDACYVVLQLQYYIACISQVVAAGAGSVRPL